MNIKAILSGSNNKIYKLLLVLVAGICLLVIVWPQTGTDSGQTAADGGSSYGDIQGNNRVDGGLETGNDDTADQMNSVSDYTDMLERKLAAVIGAMDGISNVQVMITVKDNGQKIALKDRNTSQSESGDSSQSSVDEDTVLEESGSQSTPYVTRYVQPEIEGVVICCKGAENAEMSLKITNAVQALFDVQAHKIVILESN